jgi:hypothetical protein
LRREIAPAGLRDACKISIQNNELWKMFRGGPKVAQARRAACLTVVYWVQSFREIAPLAGGPDKFLARLLTFHQS